MVGFDGHPLLGLVAIRWDLVAIRWELWWPSVGSFGGRLLVVAIQWDLVAIRWGFGSLTAVLLFLQKAENAEGQTAAIGPDGEVRLQRCAATPRWEPIRGAVGLHVGLWGSTWHSWEPIRGAVGLHVGLWGSTWYSWEPIRGAVGLHVAQLSAGGLGGGNGGGPTAPQGCTGGGGAEMCSENGHRNTQKGLGMFRGCCEGTLRVSGGSCDAVRAH